MDKKNKQRFDQTEKNEAKYMRRVQKGWQIAVVGLLRLLVCWRARERDHPRAKAEADRLDMVCFRTYFQSQLSRE